MRETVPVTIDKSKSGKNELVLPPSLLPELAGGQYAIEFGSRSFPADLAIKRSGGKTVLRLSGELLNKLLLPGGIDLFLRHEDKKLVLGPLIGIIIDARAESRPPMLPPPAQSPLSGRGVFCFFPPEQASSDKGYINATFFGCGTWKQGTLPLPEIILDFRKTRDPEPLSSALRATKARVANRPVQITAVASGSPVNVAFLGNPFVIRVLMQKNRRLSWENTLAVAVVYAAGDPVAQDGRLLEAQSVLTLAFPGKEREIMHKCLSFAFETVNRLEQYHGFLLETELDLQLSPGGDVSLKSIQTGVRLKEYMSLGDPCLVQKIIWTPVEACSAMAGFPLAEGDRQSSLPRGDKLFTIRVCKNSGKKNTLFLNRVQQRHLGCPSGHAVNLVIGTVATRVSVAGQAFDNSLHRLYVSGDVAEKIFFYKGEPLKLIASSRRILALGPSLGMTVPKYAWPYITRVSFIKKRALLHSKKESFFTVFTWTASSGKKTG